MLYRKRADEKTVGAWEGCDGALSIQPFEGSRVATVGELLGPCGRVTLIIVNPQGMISTNRLPMRVLTEAPNVLSSGWVPKR